MPGVAHPAWRAELEIGEDEDRQGAAEERAGQPDELRERAGAEPDTKATTTRTTTARSNRFHRAEVPLSGSDRGFAATSSGGGGGVPGVTVIVRSGCRCWSSRSCITRLKVAQVDDRGPLLGDIDAGRALLPGALDEGDGNVLAVDVSDDRVEDVTRLDAAGPGDLDDDVPPVDVRLVFSPTGLRVVRSGLRDHDVWLAATRGRLRRGRWGGPASRSRAPRRKAPTGTAGPLDERRKGPLRRRRAAEPQAVRGHRPVRRYAGAGPAVALGGVGSSWPARRYSPHDGIRSSVASASAPRVSTRGGCASTPRWPAASRGGSPSHRFRRGASSRRTDRRRRAGPRHPGGGDLGIEVNRQLDVGL